MAKRPYMATRKRALQVLPNKKRRMSDLKSVEFEPPAASINRIIKNVLPDNVQMTKEARAAFVRAAGIFIFYVTHAANEFTRDSKRQTVFPQDVVNALKEIGFEDFERPLLEFLDAYRREASAPKKSRKSDAKDEGGAEDEEEEEVAEEGPVDDSLFEETEAAEK